MPTGDNRRVLYLPFGLIAKFPRLKRFRTGRRCNRWEREMWQKWRPLFGWKTLCPVYFADRFGLVVVMPRAGAIASPDDADDGDDATVREFCEITAEGKPDDYRWLRNRIVVVDYGLECEAAETDQRAEYHRLLARR